MKKQNSRLRSLENLLAEVYKQNLALSVLRASEYDNIKNKKNQVTRCDFCDRIVDDDIRYCYDCEEFSE